MDKSPNRRNFKEGWWQRFASGTVGLAALQIVDTMVRMQVAVGQLAKNSPNTLISPEAAVLFVTCGSVQVASQRQTIRATLRKAANVNA
jgi:hypothetical protein